MAAYATDNYISDFPARMSDGRFMTNYFSNCDLNRKLQKNLSSWQYRLLLTESADTILDNEKKINEAKFGCESCTVNFDPDSRYVQECDMDQN